MRTILIFAVGAAVGAVAVLAALAVIALGGSDWPAPEADPEVAELWSNHPWLDPRRSEAERAESEARWRAQFELVAESDR